MHDDNNVVSVIEWIQTTQERTKKPNSECGITYAFEPWPDKDLKFPAKIQKQPVLL